MACLTIDIGNTKTALGLFETGRLIHRLQVPTHRGSDSVTATQPPAITVEATLRSELESRGMPVSSIESVGLSSVVGEMGRVWSQAAQRVFGCETKVLTSATSGLTIHFDRPELLGTDRLANVLGAIALGHSEGVVVDFGTATTFQAFRGRQIYVGPICAGVETAFAGLRARAPRLSEAPLQWSGGFIVRDTEQALSAGAFQGCMGLVERIVQGLLSELPMHSPVIIATGGLSFLLEGRTEVIEQVIPELALIGLASLVCEAPNEPSKGI